jgi:hypothetical protein
MRCYQLAHRIYKDCDLIGALVGNVRAYAKLRFCVRGISAGNSDVTKQATTTD